MPTATQTPVPTEKPVKEPKPTDTPKSPKSTSSPTLVVNKSVLTDAVVNPHLKNTTIPATKVGSAEAKPTVILGASTKPVEKKITNAPKRAVLVEGASNAVPQILVVIVGGVLLLGCGILMYLKKQKIWFWKSKT